MGRSKKAFSSNLYTLWQFLLCGLILWNFVHLVLSYIFEHTTFPGALMAEIIGVVVFALDIWLKQNMLKGDSFYNFHAFAQLQGFSRKNPRLTKAIDFASLVPFEIIAASLIDTNTGLENLRFLGLVRVFKFVDLTHINFSQAMTPVWGRIVNIGALVLSSIHFIACGWLLVNGLEEGAWLTVYNKAVYWAVTTLTTVGYGDIAPSTNGGRIYTMIVMMIGVASYGFIIGNVAHMLEVAGRHTESKKEKMNDITMFLQHYDVPSEVQNQVYQYYHKMFEKIFSDKDAHIIAELPTSLQDEIRVYMKVKLLRSLSLFQKSSNECLKTIALALETCSFSPDDQIITTGDVGQEMFIVNDGECDVIIGENVVATIGEGKFFGEVALMQDVKRTADVKARTFCELYRLGKEDFAVVLEKFPSLRDQFTIDYGTNVKPIKDDSNAEDSSALPELPSDEEVGSDDNDSKAA